MKSICLFDLKFTRTWEVYRIIGNIDESDIQKLKNFGWYPFQAYEAEE